MKKLLALLLVAAMLVVSLAACSDSGSGDNTTTTSGDNTATTVANETNSSDGSELALITDLGSIDDKSFNQGAWEGVEQYGKENNVTYKYYRPNEQSDDEYLNTINLAIEGGAKVVVTPGYLFEVPVFKAQSQHPDVTFILLDGDPHDVDAAASIASNAVGVHYAEDQAGFLAGYAAVKDGYRSLGFMGGIAVPAVVSFGYGFIQGADAAAKELELDKDAVTVKYNYTGTFSAGPDIQTKAAAWYESGTEVIFACGGGIGTSIMSAAETAGKKVIGVDVDQADESESVITSATKGLKASVYDLVKLYYAGTFPGGTSQVFDASKEGVGLPMATSRFQTFKQADYDELYAKLKSGDFKLTTERDPNGSATTIKTEFVKIDEVQ